LVIKDKIINLSMILHRIISLIFLNEIFPNELISCIIWMYYNTFRKIKFSNRYDNSLCLKDDIVYGTGSNKYRQLGIDTRNQRTTFTQSTLLSHLSVINIACGRVHSVFHTKDGNLYGLGVNPRGQLGTPHFNTVCIEPRLLDINNVISVSCGSDFTIAQTKDGLFSTGINEIEGHYKLYQCFARKGSTSFGFGLIKISNVINFKCSALTLFVLTKDGLYSCGENESRQLGLSLEVHNKKKYINKLKKIDLDDIQSYYNGSHSSLILSSTGLFLCKYKNSPSRVNVDMNIIHFMTKAYIIYFTTKDGLYLFDTADNGVFTGEINTITKENSMLVFSNPNILSISSSNSGGFIETETECYGWGESSQGELGIGKIRVRVNIVDRYQVNKIVFE
jgi:alpha-tubulin suppressor-like RCC1 family protein